MKVVAVVLLIASGGLLYLTLVKKKSLSDIWRRVSGFFKPPSGGATATVTG